MLEKKVLNTINKYELIKNGDTIVVGVSGGPDSMTLLNILINLKQKLNINIVVAHVNHMIRKEADEETTYVIEFCKKNNIECFIKKEDVEKIAKERKLGTEEAGRNLRYDFFDEIANKINANKIATAHNSNDNAETVLMNIIRGSSTSGLKGIEPIRDNKFIRPLIECNRKEIEEYTKKENLNPKFDKTNKENIYTRNKVRNMLIPYIEENFNPNFVNSLNRLSELASIENDYLDKKTIESFEKIIISQSIGNKENLEQNGIVLNLKEFNKLDFVIKNRVILYTISKVLGNSQNIEKTNVEDIVKLCENNIGNKYLTPNKNIKVLINKGKIFFFKQN